MDFSIPPPVPSLHVVLVVVLLGGGQEGVKGRALEGRGNRDTKKRGLPRAGGDKGGGAILKTPCLKARERANELPARNEKEM